MDSLKAYDLSMTNQYPFFKDKIQANRSTFVKTKHYDEAICILNESNVCVISGNPGVGKTSLSFFLLSEYIDKGYEPIIAYRISDIKSIIDLKRKCIILVDDFLGSISLELEKDHEDKEITAIITSLTKRNTTKLILSTRENILSSAKIRFEGLSRIDYKKIVIIMNELTKSNKADIFYSIITNSQFDNAHKLELLKEKRYKTIVEHNNYNPRLIEALLNEKLFNTSVDQYYSVIIENLNNPTWLWEKPYNELLFNSQIVLMSLCLYFRSPIKLQDINNQYSEYFYHHKQEKVFLFETAIKIIHGSFISIGKLIEQNVISFDNPSIRDFMLKKISNSDDLIMMCADLCLNIQHCNQLFELSKSKVLSNQYIRNKMTELYLKIMPNDSDVTFYEKIHVLKYMYMTKDTRLVGIRSDIIAYFFTEIGHAEFYSFSSFFHYLSEFLPANYDLRVLHNKYIEYIKNLDFDSLDLSSIESISSIIEYTKLYIDNDDFNLIKEKVMVIDDNYYNLSKSDYSESEYAWSDFSDLQHIANVFQVKFSSEYHIQSIAEELDEERDELLMNADYDDSGYDRDVFKNLESERHSFYKLDQLCDTYKKNKQ
ncbi:MAG: hypothetical protein KA140_03515 [Caldisericia bacterium]|nr:hypothetical protein [Caldisericia bacterium]